jgi:hypothetical protein
MNERILVLAEQALFESDFDDEQNIKITMDIFAELIIRECINVVKKRYMGDNNREDMEVKRCIEDLKNYWS